MPWSTMSLVMLTGALWMVINPGWWIRISQDFQDELNRLPLGRPRFARAAGRVADDRRTRLGVQLTGALLALVAAIHLYEQALWMLAHYV